MGGARPRLLEPDDPDHSTQSDHPDAAGDCGPDAGLPGCVRWLLAPSATGVAVTYAVPSPAGGRAPATVNCSPASGDVFPVGPTRVTCTATDAAAATATCTFDVTVARVPQLTRTRFLAFGDSVTAGEVTAPVAGLGGDRP